MGTTSMYQSLYPTSHPTAYAQNTALNQLNQQYGPGQYVHISNQGMLNTSVPTSFGQQLVYNQAAGTTAVYIKPWDPLTASVEKAVEKVKSFRDELRSEIDAWLKQ